MPEWMQEEDRTPRVLLLTARPEELQPALRNLKGAEQKLHQNHPYHLWSTPRVQVRLTHTGVGKEASTRTLAALGGVLQPDFVLVAGTAGGLREDLEVGSLFFPTAVTEPGSEEWIYPSTEILEWLRTIAASRDRGGTVRAGPQVTAEEGVLGRKERQELARRHDAMAVDMETFYVLRRLQDFSTNEELLWAGMRVISDGLDDNHLEQVLARQEPACERLGEHLARFFAALEAPETWEGSRGG